VQYQHPGSLAGACSRTSSLTSGVILCAGCSHASITVEQGKTYLIRVVNAGTLDMESLCFSVRKGQLADQLCSLLPTVLGVGALRLSCSIGNAPAGLPLCLCAPCACTKSAARRCSKTQHTPQNIVCTLQGHKLTIVAADDTPVEPLEVDCVDVNLGQRCCTEQRCSSVACLFYVCTRAQAKAPLPSLSAQSTCHSVPSAPPCDTLLPATRRYDLLLKADKPVDLYWMRSASQVGA
jgi:Multicopper oxidase